MLSFEQFRDKLADIVLVAINTKDSVCAKYCPLALHPDLNMSSPV